jgi:hypothetical protein
MPFLKRFARMIQSNRCVTSLPRSENVFAGEDSIIAQVMTIFDGLYQDVVN